MTSREGQKRRVRITILVEKHRFSVILSRFTKGFLPQFLRVSKGWSVGNGSGVVTSRPAAAILPLDRASYRSSWFTTVPLGGAQQPSKQQYMQQFSTLGGILLIRQFILIPWHTVTWGGDKHMSSYQTSRIHVHYYVHQVGTHYNSKKCTVLPTDINKHVSFSSERCFEGFVCLLGN